MGYTQTHTTHTRSAREDEQVEWEGQQQTMKLISFRARTNSCYQTRETNDHLSFHAFIALSPAPWGTAPKV